MSRNLAFHTREDATAINICNFHSLNIFAFYFSQRLEFAVWEWQSIIISLSEAHEENNAADDDDQ